MSQHHNYTEYAEKAGSWAKEVAAELSVPEEKAERIIRKVLHTLRHQIPIEESFNLIAQLPMIWKGTYVDGWKIQEPYQRMNGWSDYLKALRESDKNLAGFDFGNDQQAKHAVLSVWKLLFKHVSESEMKQICNNLPRSISADIENFSKETIV